MSVGYTCDARNAQGSACAIHDAGNAYECRTAGEPRLPVRNTASNRGDFPGGASNPANTSGGTERRKADPLANAIMGAMVERAQEWATYAADQGFYIE